MVNRYWVVSLLSLFLAAGSAHAMTLDDFESYVDSDALTASWVPAFNGTETLELTNVFEGSQAMKIEYQCNQGSFATVYTYTVDQDWTSFTTLSLMFLGQVGNSGEKIVVEIRDPWGGYLKGDPFENGTQVADWTEYSMDISGWANRQWVKEIKIWLEAVSWGVGTVYFDYLLLPTAISVDGDTWSGIKSLYADR